MCDIAHAHLLEQVEGDVRIAYLLNGDANPDDAREAVEDYLDSDLAPTKDVDPEVAALNRALGVGGR